MFPLLLPSGAHQSPWLPTTNQETVDSPVDFTSLASPQGAEDWVLVGSEHPIETGLEVPGIKGGEEAQGTHAEADDRGQGGVLHKEGGQMQHCAIAAQGYAEVHICIAGNPCLEGSLGQNVMEIFG